MNDLEKFMKAVREAQKLAIKENIQANAIIINEKYVKIAPFLMPNRFGGIDAYNPMICGLDMHFTIDELPDNYSFAILENKNKTDVELVKHGMWDKHGYCSVCDYWTCYCNDYKYCPNCGAKMDEGDEHDKKN